MSLSSLPSPGASGSARSRALPSAPGTTPGPSTPVGATGMEAGGLKVLPEPLSSPKPSRPSDAATGSPLPSARTLSTLISLFCSRMSCAGLVVLRSWGCSLWFCGAGTKLALDMLRAGRLDDRCCAWALEGGGCRCGGVCWKWECV